MFVMEPLVEGAASPGNVGRNFRAIRQALLARILAIVRERCPTTGVVPDPKAAVERGATTLLVPSIVEWKEMRTDDSFGAFLGSHNQITVELRLMRLQPPAVMGRLRFKNRARLTLNQSATRLLNESFRKAVLQLVAACR
jgi:hypothetical protein